MKAFDLNAAISGKPLQKLNGEKVTFVTYLPKADYYNRLVVLNSEGEIQAYSDEGIYNIWGDFGPNDLRMAPEKKTVWINLYPANTIGNLFSLGYFYDDEEEANKRSSVNGNRLGGKAYPVEVEI